MTNWKDYILVFALLFASFSQINACECTNAVVTQCPAGCIPEECVTEEVSCECETGCSTKECILGYKEIFNVLCTGSAVNRTCQLTEVSFLCNACEPGFFGENCAECDCALDEVCDEGIDGTGECFISTAVPTPAMTTPSPSCFPTMSPHSLPPTLVSTLGPTFAPFSIRPSATPSLAPTVKPTSTPLPSPVTTFEPTAAPSADTDAPLETEQPTQLLGVSPQDESSDRERTVTAVWVSAVVVGSVGIGAGAFLLFQKSVIAV